MTEPPPSIDHLYPGGQRSGGHQAVLSKIPELPPQSVAEHYAILDAMARGDPTSARDLAEGHIRTLSRYREFRT